MKILLVTLHAKYVHASLALPYLAAASRDLEGAEFQIMELTVNEQPDRLLSRIVDAEADAVFFSCYIWNTELTLRIAADLKLLAPDTFLVLGGPEASFGAFEIMERYPAIDCIVRGEGEETCREVLQALVTSQSLEGVSGLTYRDHSDTVANPQRTPIKELDRIPSPFAAGLVDLKKPLVYLETSRGCPFSCAFCMSATEEGVRSFSMERIKSDLALLMDAEVRTIKFVDRTFNYDARRAREIWNFILEHNRASTFHFEIAAQLLDDETVSLLSRVPPERFRFEIGVQSTGEETLSRVSRVSNLERLFENVQRLLTETSVTVHLDLVAGLPGEDFPSFLASLQSLLDLAPHHIQVEPLKVLKGTPMRAIARKEGYRYSQCAPYKVLKTPWLSFREIRRIEGISRLLDLLYNSGRFAMTLKALSGALSETVSGSSAPPPHDGPQAFSLPPGGEGVPQGRMRGGQLHAGLFAAAADFFETEEPGFALSLAGLFQALWRFTQERLNDASLELVRDALSFDYCLTGYPTGNMPGFFEATPQAKGHSVPAAALAARPGERVRYFRGRFARDYRENPWGEGEVEITFIYRTAPGEGLKVEIL